MVWILFEVHWDVECGTELKEQRPQKRTAVVQMKCDGDLGYQEGVSRIIRIKQIGDTIWRYSCQTVMIRFPFEVKRKENIKDDA